MVCEDCREDVEKLDSCNLCKRCAMRKRNALNRGKEYIPIKNLTEEERQRIDRFRNGHKKSNNRTNQSSLAINKKETSINKFNKNKFLELLNQFGCKISEDNLNEVLNVLDQTYILKNLIITIAKGNNQQVMLDIEQSLNAIERKLQHEWEYNGFKEEDDNNFKSFLVFRRKLKSAIYFWKKVYSSNVIEELNKAWEAYIADPSEKNLLAGDTLESKLRRYQISTETISTLMNTRKPFVRVFYASDEKKARELLTNWLQERNLHENKSKTKIVEM